MVGFEEEARTLASQDGMDPLGEQFFPREVSWYSPEGAGVRHAGRFGRIRGWRWGWRCCGGKVTLGFVALSFA